MSLYFVFKYSFLGVYRNGSDQKLFEGLTVSSLAWASLKKQIPTKKQGASLRNPLLMRQLRCL